MIADRDGNVRAQKIASGSQLYTEYMFSLAQIRQAADETRDVYGFGMNLWIFMSMGAEIGDTSEGTKRAHAPKRDADGQLYRRAALLPAAPAQPASLTQPPRRSSPRKRKQPQP